MTLSINWNRLRAGKIEDLDRVLEHLERELDKLKDIQQLVVSSLVTSDYDAQANELVLCDPTNGAFTVKLPDVRTAHDAFVTVVNVSSSTNTITIPPRPGQLIGTAATPATIAAAGPVQRRFVGKANEQRWWRIA